MKKSLLGLIGLSCAMVAGVLFVNNQEKVTVDNSMVSLREKHQNFLENNPFKESLKLSKSERRANGLPPNKFYEQDYLRSINPNTGKTEPEKIIALQEQLNLDGASMRSPGDVGNEWVERGPNNVGGRTRTLMFDPNDATNKRVFAGGVSGGLWVNEDITTDTPWTQVTGVPGNMAVSCMTVDPNDSQVMYIGTGELYTSGDASGNGVYKSTDGGVTWVNIYGGSTGATSTGGQYMVPGVYYIQDIVAWDADGSAATPNDTEVFIAVGATYWGGSDSITTFMGVAEFGLYKSTNDGSTWSKVTINNGNGRSHAPNDIEVSPVDNKLWLGTTRNIFGDVGGTVLSSTNGSTFTQEHVFADTKRTEIAVSSTNANTLYVLAESTLTNPTTPKIYKTTNGFSAVPTSMALPNDVDDGIPATDFARNQAFYDLMIEVDPTDDDIVYVGGIDIFRATDGIVNTNSWKQISKWSNNNNLAALNCSLVHADQHAMTFRPGNSNQALFGNDGGIFYSSSLSNAQANATISSRNTNFNVTQFYKGGFGPSDTNELLLAGAQDNGTQLLDGAVAGINSAAQVWGGDGAYSTIDKDGGYMIVSYVQNTHVYLNLPWTGGPTGYYIEQAQTEGSFINEACLDHNLDIMYSNGTTRGTANYAINRYALEANSATKTRLTNALLTNAPNALKVSPYTTGSSTLIVGLQNGVLLKLTNANGTPAWSQIGTFTGSISDIEFGASEDDIFITIQNYGVTSIYATSNGTNASPAWDNKEGNLPDIPVRCILQNPTAGNSNEVIVGTELGVWRTDNFNDATPSWTQSYNGMSDVKVMDLDLRAVDNAVLATTFGRGMFTGVFTDNAVLDVDEAELAANTVKVYPTVSNGDVKIKSSVNYSDTKVNVFDINGKLVYETSLRVDSNTVKNVNLNLNSGVYFMNLSNETLNKTSKLIIK